ncbi:hypothetical protein D9M69_573870 [compost metagenome]
MPVTRLGVAVEPVFLKRVLIQGLATEDLAGHVLQVATVLVRGKFHETFDELVIFAALRRAIGGFLSAIRGVGPLHPDFEVFADRSGR